MKQDIDYMDGYNPPKPYKKSKKKEFSVKIVNNEPAPKDTKYRFLFRGWTTKYETLKAASQAVESWQKGQGTLGGHLCKESYWEAHLIGPEGLIKKYNHKGEIF